MSLLPATYYVLLSTRVTSGNHGIGMDGIQSLDPWECHLEFLHNSSPPSPPSPLDLESETCHYNVTGDLKYHADPTQGGRNVQNDPKVSHWHVGRSDHFDISE